MTRRVRIGPRDEVIVAGPDTAYRWVSLETSGADATVHLRTVDGQDWSVDRPPLAEEPEPARRPDREARAAFVDDPDPIGLAAARVGIEHVEHHGRPLRFAGSSLAGDLYEHRFRCREQGCPFVLTWTTES